jgi:hypothetical protein
MMVQRVHEMLDGAGVGAGKHGRGTTGMVERIEMLIKTHNALGLLLNDAMVALMLARRNPAMPNDEAWQRRVDELRQVHEAISQGDGEPILGYDVVLEMMYDAEAENEQLCAFVDAVRVALQSRWLDDVARDVRDALDELEERLKNDH